jgi:hypothetical protein
MRQKRAIVERRQPVDVKDVSRGGCCLESVQPLNVGAFGVLVVEIQGAPHAEVFRVARSTPIVGEQSQYEAGVEFLPMPAETPSLVEVVAELDHRDTSPERIGRRLKDVSRETDR